MLKTEIQNLITKIIQQNQKQKIWPKFVIPEIKIEYPENPKYGDYATNVALRLSKLVGKNPVEIAENLRSQISNLKTELFEKIEVVKPGFVNFKLSQKYLADQISEILKKEKNFGKSNLGKDKKVQVEFISANPTGPLTLGNGRGAFFGDTLARVFSRCGFKVEREYYWNDAKTSAQILGLGKTLKGEEIVYKGAYINELPKKIKTKYKKDIKKLSVKQTAFYAIEILKGEIKNFVKKKLKIKFNTWFSEQSLYDEGSVDKTLKLLEQKNLVYAKEGATWFRAKDYGDEEDRVLVRSDGTPTYFLSDTAYHKNKFDRNFDKVIDIWGADHAGYIKRLQGAMVAISEPAKLDILIAQLVRLIRAGKEVRMSKREGIFVKLEELIDEVGLDSSRFFFLMYSLNTHMNFDLDRAKERSEKNPVFYVQYAHARICSIIKKSKVKSLPRAKSRGQKSKVTTLDLTLLTYSAELSLIRELIKFPEILQEIVQNYEIHRLPNYAISLADKFHNFYEKCRVLDENIKLSQARLALVLATKTVLKNTLNCLGVTAPERMQYQYNKIAR
jgi:arginyl-tRNA synthetase